MGYFWGYPGLHPSILKIVYLIFFIVFNATINNISAISWRPVLVVEEAGENHRPWASNWYALSLAAASRVHLLFVIYQAVLVIDIGCYELLGNPTI